MDEEKYEAIKGDNEKLLREIACSCFGEDGLIDSFSDDFKREIIKNFIFLDNPELIFGTYCFITNYGKLQEFYDKAIIQIGEGKFQNYILGSFAYYAKKVY